MCVCVYIFLFLPKKHTLGNTLKSFQEKRKEMRNLDGGVDGWVGREFRGKHFSHETNFHSKNGAIFNEL